MKYFAPLLAALMTSACVTVIDAGVSSDQGFGTAAVFAFSGDRNSHLDHNRLTMPDAPAPETLAPVPDHAEEGVARRQILEDRRTGVAGPVVDDHDLERLGHHGPDAALGSGDQSLHTSRTAHAAGVAAGYSGTLSLLAARQ